MKKSLVRVTLGNFAYFADICVILCLCVAVCGRQFLSRVDILMQFSDVFWEPFMGMSCFYAICLQAGEVWLHFYKVCWQPFMGISYFLVQKSMPGTNDAFLPGLLNPVHVWRWGQFCMHFYRVCWIPSMGMLCFLVRNCAHITKVSCFSVHFCSQLSPISCFVCFFPGKG